MLLKLKESLYRVYNVTMQLRKANYVKSLKKKVSQYDLFLSSLKLFQSWFLLYFVSFEILIDTGNLELISWWP